MSFLLLNFWAIHLVRLGLSGGRILEEFFSMLAFPREARDLIFKIRSCTVRSDLKNNKKKTAENTFFLRSDLTVQDRILKIRYFLLLWVAKASRIHHHEATPPVRLGLSG